MVGVGIKDMLVVLVQSMAACLLAVVMHVMES